ncbi:MAG TPA: hypothetical protein VHH10_15340 [Rubrobacteraceae bacterium]|nr:hypothetical protein [Rubrobacteraceae bacterium]
MGRRGNRRGPQGRAQGRSRGRVRERVQGRSQGRTQGRGGQSAGRQRVALDVDAIEGYANRLRGQLGESGSGLGSASGLGAAASGLAGAASGLAGGSLASRLTGGGSEGSEEEFRNEVRERLDLIDERVQRLEDEVALLLGEGGATEDLAEPEGEPGPEAGQ